MSTVDRIAAAIAAGAGRLWIRLNYTPQPGDLLIVAIPLIVLAVVFAAVVI